MNLTVKTSRQLIEDEKRPTRILVADDHSAVLESLVPILELEFTVVGTASDGKAAVEAEEKLHPDVVVLDISMPVMSGIDAAKQMRKGGFDSSDRLPHSSSGYRYPCCRKASGWVGLRGEESLENRLDIGHQGSAARSRFRLTVLGPMSLERALDLAPLPPDSQGGFTRRIPRRRLLALVAVLFLAARGFLLEEASRMRPFS